jgi:hypothetical protein
MTELSLCTLHPLIFVHSVSEIPFPDSAIPFPDSAREILGANARLKFTISEWS